MRVFVPLVLLLAGCSAATRAKMEIRRDSRTLSEAASDYWLALRWGDVQTASGFLGTPEERVRLGHLVSEPRVRITDAAVVQIVVGEKLPEARLPETREGVAVVRVESYDVVSGRARVETIEQHWVCAGRTWTVDETQSALGSDRPW